jgi:O-antigen ligase
VSKRKKKEEAAEEVRAAKVETRNWVAVAVLVGLLVVLGLRMTMSEQLRQTLSQKAAYLAEVAKGKGDEVPRFVGPAVTVGLGVVTGVFATVAAWIAGRKGALSWGRVGRFAMVVVVIGWAVVGAFLAENKFNALVGAVDLGMCLLAGWTVSVLCLPRVLGHVGRRIVVAGLVGILAVWVFHGFYQKYVENPDAIAEYHRNKAEHLAKVGIPITDAVKVKLFESRMMTREVTGFLSLSNVMAAGLIGLMAVLAGMLAARLVRSARVAEVERKEGEIPLETVAWWAGIILLVAGIVVAVLTGSRGGALVAVGCVAAIFVGTLFWERVVAWRRVLVVGAFVAMLAGAMAVIGYGVTNDALPSKTLTFRWHYWTAAAKLIAASPWTGVGLNNFGEHYLSVKRASSPEEVADPHSFFVRVAAEMGVPAVVMVAGLTGWMLWRGLGRVHARGDGGMEVGQEALWVAGAACALWWTLHFYIAETPFAYNVYLAVMFAVLAAVVAWGAMVLLGMLNGTGVRVVMVAGLVGAVGMLVYDQINMALVTGAVAMMFWALLGVGDSYEVVDPPAGKTMNAATWGVAGLCGVSTLLLVGLVWGPMLENGNAWDPAPREERYLRASAMPGNEANALKFLDQAIVRSPRRIELMFTRVMLKLAMKQSVAEDVRRILELDRAGAKLRVQLGSLETDLPREERVRILEEGLRLDEALPEGEVRKMSAAERERVKGLIRELQGRRD